MGVQVPYLEMRGRVQTFDIEFSLGRIAPFETTVSGPGKDCQADDFRARGTRA